MEEARGGDFSAADHEAGFSGNVVTEWKEVLDGSLIGQCVGRKEAFSPDFLLGTAIAEALEIKKGEVLEWYVEDGNTLVLRRRKLRKPRSLKSIA